MENLENMFLNPGEQELSLEFPESLDFLLESPQTQNLENFSQSSYPILQPGINTPPWQGTSTASADFRSYPQEETEQNIKEEEFSPYQLPQMEQTMNLTPYVGSETPPPSTTPASPLPFLYLSLNPNPGAYQFSATIPGHSPTAGGRRPKWFFSNITNKLYAAKNVTFPINIQLQRIPADGSLVLCPIYTEPENRTISVDRCFLCKSADKNPKANNNIIQVEGMNVFPPNYFFKDNRYMVSVPLPRPAPGDTSSQIFVKIGCNTSCLGGPSRRYFSILIILIVNNVEMGRQVIHTKSCEGPLRDMKNDEALKRKRDEAATAEEEKMKKEDDNSCLQSVRLIASDIATKWSSKKRTMKGKVMKLKSKEMEFNAEELMRVPVRFQKKVKRYVNFLAFLEEQEKNPDPNFKKFYPSETDSE